MNFGDIIRHEGTVTEAGDDLSISVMVPSISDTPLDDVGPEFVFPLRWRPREGDLVVIHQRAGALRPEQQFTWAGWSWNADDRIHLLPPWLDAGKLHLISEDGRIVIALEDEADPIDIAASGAGVLVPGEQPFLRLGRRDATEQLVCGLLWRTKLEDVIAELITTADKLEKAAATLETAVWDVPAGLLVAPSGGGPVTGTTTASPTSADSTAFKDVKDSAATVSTSLTSLRDSLHEVLSDYVFTSKVPEPEVPTP